MAYKAGGFYMPTSPGPFVVDGLGFRPQALVFFGGNRSEEEVFVSGGSPGAFFGLVWLDQATGLIDQQSTCNIAFATGFQPEAIHIFSSGTTFDYRAVCTSLDADGFTLNVTNGADGSRWVHYLAIGDFDGCEGSTMASLSNATYDFLGLGYRPLTALSFHHWPSGAVRTLATTAGYVFSMGVRNFNKEVADLGDITSAAQAIVMRITTQLGPVGWTDYFNGFFDTTITLSVRPGLVGTILQADDKAFPYPARTSEGIRWQLNGYPTRHSGIWWDGEGSAHFVSVPEVGAENVYTARANIQDIEAALFFGSNGYERTEGSSPQVAYNYGVLTDDYQGCVAFDTGLGVEGPTGIPAFFQSKEMCHVGSVRTPGARAASGEIQGNQIVLTGEVADNIQWGSNFVQMYGRSIPHASMWMMEV